MVAPTTILDNFILIHIYTIGNERFFIIKPFSPTEIVHCQLSIVN